MESIADSNTDSNRQVPTQRFSMPSLVYITKELLIHRGCFVWCSAPWQALNALLADDNKFGFIVMDGNGALFGTLCGNTRDVLHKFTVDLPKKHGKYKT